MLIHCLLPTVLLSSMAFAQDSWLEFNAGASANSSPLVQFNGTWDSFLTFDVELRGLLVETVTVNSQNYLRFSTSPGTVPADSVGYPELPVVRRMVWLPDDSDIALEYSASCCDGIDCLPIYPAPLDSLVQDSTCTPYIGEYFRLDSTAYASKEWYPEVQAELVGEFRLRDLRVGIVDVYPVQYLASEDSLRVWSDIEISLSWDEGNAVWSEVGLGHYDNLICDNLLGYTPESQPINSGTGSVERVDAEDLIDGPGYAPDYIILVAAGLDGTWVRDLADHRDDLNGFKVAIVRTDDVLECYGGEETILTPHMIRDFTEDMWEWGESPGDRPTYLLLIGDHEDDSFAEEDWFLPTHVVPVDENSLWEWANDSWYVLFDENPLALSAPPDMIVGRLPARDTDNLDALVDVIIDFESDAGWPPSSGLSWRRWLTRLSGQNVIGETSYTYDPWEPDAEWISTFADWLGYDFDNLNCGDGDDEDEGDGSDVTASEWVDTLTEWFERGQQVAFYSNHGETHMLSAGIQWEPDSPDSEVPDHMGMPDSVFDSFDARGLGEGIQSHPHPFVIALSCLNGTFNHTLAQHEFTNPGEYVSSFHFNDDSLLPPIYDYGTDCLAEAWIKNAESGAIGVFASSEVSDVGMYDLIGSSILRAIFERGFTRQGDAICAGRLACLDQYSTSSGWSDELGRFNLMGDPAVDIGDRVRFPDRCDLLIGPEDILLSRYPTRSISGSNQLARLQVTIRNTGAMGSGAFDATLRVTSGNNYDTTLTATCSGLPAGAQGRLSFGWRVPRSIDPPVEITLHAIADPEEDCDDSWTANNDASQTLLLQDFYPNEEGFPIRLPGAPWGPPALADLDGDDSLEIVTVCGSTRIMAWDLADLSEPLWSFHHAGFSSSQYPQGFTIPVIADVCGSSALEVVVDSADSLLVLDGETGELICSWPHHNPASLLMDFPHTVCVADIWPGNSDSEIALLCRGPSYQGSPTDVSLLILAAGTSSMTLLDSVPLPESHNSSTGGWVAADDILRDATSELVVAYTWYASYLHHSGVWIYDYDQITSSAGFCDSLKWDDDELTFGIPAVGSLGTAGIRIALPRQTGTRTHAPAYLLDTGLALQDSCNYSANDSYDILCCMMSDWDSVATGLDRVIAPAENQCFVWLQNGLGDWNGDYEGAADGYRPPFGALGDLDYSGSPDLLAGTRTGLVQAYSYEGNTLVNLGFPYALPSEVYGGFCIADIEGDGKVEVIFSTMDNYLHAWELGPCVTGYAPWPQVQHDVARTGAQQ